MKILGLIAEYNPFHNGHLYHIQEAKKLTKCDLCVCVMSSSFTMRGELSIVDKFTKAKEAILSGIDLVIELPFCYTVSNSDVFSSKALEILSLIGVDEICIGSESNDVKLYEKAYKCYNTKESKEIITDFLSKGYSYKFATNQVINLESNDLLGYSYYKAIKDNNYNIKLSTIKREGNNYLDDKINTSSFQSAKTIRNNLDIIDKYTPNFSFMSNYKYLDEKKLYKYIQYKILIEKKDILSNYFLVDEGIESLFKKYVSLDYDSFINTVTSKRYTTSRIKRTLLYILFSITRDDMKMILNDKIDYIRVLGTNKKGLEYMKEIKKDINIYTNIKEGINSVLDIEILISKFLDNVYNLDLFSKEQGKPLIIDE